MAVRDAREEAASLRHVSARLERLLRHALSEARGALVALVSSYGMRRTQDRVAQGLQRIDDMSAAMAASWRVAVRGERERARGLELRLGLVHPRAVLGRGYCICRREAGGTIVTDAASLGAGDGLSLEFALGRASARVTAKEGSDVSAT
jgi:exonuclease VII large subunit